MLIITLNNKKPVSALLKKSTHNLVSSYIFYPPTISFCSLNSTYLGYKTRYPHGFSLVLKFIWVNLSDWIYCYDTNGTVYIWCQARLMVDNSRQNVWLGYWRLSAETHTLRQEGARVVGEVAHAHHLPSYALGYDNNFKRCHYIQLIVKRFFNCLNHNFN